MEAAVTIAVRCLGDFQVLADDKPLEHWQAGKARDLFQYLLLNKGSVTRREKLVEVLWPDAVWSPRASSLKVAVHAVRKVLRTASRSVEIRHQDHGYVLAGDDLWLDVDEFEARVQAGRAAEDNDDDPGALAEYTRAAHLYAGDLLATETADWIVGRRECCRALALHALGHLRADAMRRGDQSRTIELCGRLLDIDPYYEESYQTLMVTHGRRGELGQVRNWHEICVKRLREDLDIAPTDTTLQIFNRAVRGELRDART
jgi:two-component SAPR family response regulator